MLSTALNTSLFVCDSAQVRVVLILRGLELRGLSPDFPRGFGAFFLGSFRLDGLERLLIVVLRSVQSRAHGMVLKFNLRRIGSERDGGRSRRRDDRPNLP